VVEGWSWKRRSCRGRIVLGETVLWQRDSLRKDGLVVEGRSWVRWSCDGEGQSLIRRSYEMILYGTDLPEVMAAFVNPVAKNGEGYTKCQLKGAQVTKELYAKITFPSMKDF
jgi:hypothetical protein